MEHSQNWYHKPNIKNILPIKTILTIIDKILLQGNCVDGSILFVVREPIFHRFTSDKISWFGKFRAPEKLHKKGSVMNIALF